MTRIEKLVKELNEKGKIKIKSMGSKPIYMNNKYNIGRKTIIKKYCPHHFDMFDIPKCSLNCNKCWNTVIAPHNTK